jgi:hypothetical protein
VVVEVVIEIILVMVFQEDQVVEDLVLKVQVVGQVDQETLRQLVHHKEMQVEQVEEVVLILQEVEVEVLLLEVALVLLIK